MHEQLREAIKSLRALQPEYRKLDADARKKVRARLYREEGAYAKAFVILLNAYDDKDKELA